MKLRLLWVLFCVFSNSTIGQVVNFQYKNVGGVLVENIPLTKQTHEIIIELGTTVTNFRLTVTKLPNKSKLLLKDKDGDPIGNPIDSNGTFDNDVAPSLNENRLKIFLIDDKNDTTLFADVLMLSQLPTAQLNALKDIAPLIRTIDTDPCFPCDYANNVLIYDFAKNTLSKGAGSLPVVDKPFTLSIRNINPFRDSIVINQETADYIQKFLHYSPRHFSLLAKRMV